jgi:hypothetical protein
MAIPVIGSRTINVKRVAATGYFLTANERRQRWPVNKQQDALLDELLKDDTDPKDSPVHMGC